MAKYASWVHGNALTVESPDTVARMGHFGWGADVLLQPGQASWFHIALPTPVLVAERTKLQTAFLLFKTDPGKVCIQTVHVYDGSCLLQEFNDLHLEGAHHLEVDNQNTFRLPVPHELRFGVGISFFCVAPTGFENGASSTQLILAAAGADFVI